MLTFDLRVAGKSPREQCELRVMEKAWYHFEGYCNYWKREREHFEKARTKAEAVGSINEIEAIDLAMIKMTAHCFRNMRRARAIAWEAVKREDRAFLARIQGPRSAFARPEVKAEDVERPLEDVERPLAKVKAQAPVEREKSETEKNSEMLLRILDLGPASGGGAGQGLIRQAALRWKQEYGKEAREEAASSSRRTRRKFPAGSLSGQSPPPRASAEAEAAYRALWSDSQKSAGLLAAGAAYDALMSESQKSLVAVERGFWQQRQQSGKKKRRVRKAA